MVHHASRIESNCFGLYANPAPPRPPPSPDAAETETETNAGGHGAGSGEESGEKSPPPPQQQQRPPKNAVIGRVVYLEASMFNHSCDPCCEISREATEACEVTLLRNVARGEELTISYIDEDKPYSHRQKSLQGSYHFTCVCAKCCSESLEGKRKKKQGRGKKKAGKGGGGKGAKKASAGAHGAGYDDQVNQAMQKLLQM